MRCNRHTRAIVLTLALILSVGCAQTGFAGSAGLAWSYFAHSSTTDPWSPKIAGWQSREKATLNSEMELAAVSGSSADAPPASQAVERGEASLRDKYAEFRRVRKREMAREVAAWIQTEARSHYVADGPIDHWATLEGTLERNGDDCDGLELLVYHFLRDLGFEETEVYRAIVVRRSDGQHHMVTFWFEEPGDPWVIDPTGAMVSGMPRMSDIPDWEPLKIFSETEEFSARPIAAR